MEKLTKTLALVWVATAAGRALAQDPFLDTLVPAPTPILAYSESVAPLYEGFWPSGRVQPLYRKALDGLRRHLAFDAALERFRRECADPTAEPLPRPIRLPDYERTIAPGLAALAGELAAAIARPGRPAPAIAIDVAVTPETPDIVRRWMVHGVHPAPVEWLLRPWLTERAMARSFPTARGGAVRGASMGPQELVAWLARSAPPGTGGLVAVRVAAGASHPVWAALAEAGAVPFQGEDELQVGAGVRAGGRRIGVLYDEQMAFSSRKREALLQLAEYGALAIVPAPAQQRYCGWGVRNLPPPSQPADPPTTEPLAGPAVRSFARPDGTLDRDLVAAVFRRDQKGLYDKWRARSTRFRAADGALVLDGLAASHSELVRMETRVRRDPASVWAQDYHRPARLGPRDLYHHFSVLARGADVLTNAPGAARAVADSGDAAWLPGLLVADGDPGAPERSVALARPLPRAAAEASARFDAVRYERDVRWLAGEREEGRMRLANRANGLPDNQLPQLLEQLEARYRSLGLRPAIQRFRQDGRDWANLWVDLGPPARVAGGVVILADHYDTAIDEATAESGDRTAYRAAPGADDNASATAVLLEAGRVLPAVLAACGMPRKTIRLLHLTGEEYPADCLGARRYAERCLAEGEKLDAFLVMDMIGWNSAKGAGEFQLNEGEAPLSGRLSGLALAARQALPVASPVPAVRSRFDPRSYLYNTDAIIFSDLGVPSLLFNEHVNRLDNFSRRGNHDAYDTPDRIDFRYAAAIARVALMTAIAAAWE